MQPAFLLPKELTECTLRVWVEERSPAAGLVVRRGLADEQRLTSVHRGEVVVQLTEGKLGTQRLAPDNPELTPRQLGNLDRFGVVKVGTRLEAHDVLVSVLEVLHEKKAREPGMEWVKDMTEFVPEGWEGAKVENVTKRSRKEVGRGAPESLLQQIEFTLRLEQPLTTGDVLSQGHLKFGVIGEIRADAQMPRVGDQVADVIVPAATANQGGWSTGMHELTVSKWAETGAFTTFATSNCPRSLITHEPLRMPMREDLGSPHPERPCKLSLAQIKWLRERGLNALVAELVCTKSDDLTGARTLMKHTGPIDPHFVPAPDTPGTLRVIENELWAFGLVTDFRTDGEHVSLTLRPATRAEVLARSAGPIQKPETINYRTYDPEPGGIMCPQVFGKESELNQSGHFELACGIVPIFWRVGKPSVLQSLLGIDSERIEGLVHYRVYLRGSLPAPEWMDTEQLQLKNEPPSEGWISGAQAILHLLEQVPAERLPAGLQGRISAIVQDILNVSPVWTRPLVLLSSGNFATSDLNDLYRRIVNRSNRLRKLVELKAPYVILANEQRMLQEAVDVFHANTLLDPKLKVNGSAGKPLKDLTAIGLVRLSGEHEKRVDWRGQARSVVDPSLPPDVVQLPRFIFETLRLAPGEVVLLTRTNGIAFVACQAQLAEGHAIRLSEFADERLGKPGSYCDVHRPLGTAARVEALRVNESQARFQFPDDPLLTAEGEMESLVELAQAVALGRTIQFDSPRGVMLAGLNSVTFPRDAMYVRDPAPQKRLVPSPPPPPPKNRNPTNEEIDRVIQTCRRKVCLFTPQRSDAKLPPLQGRVGGRPCLPPEMPWPTEDGKPQPFLAQLPLDSLGTFPPGSLLTFFWSAITFEGNGPTSNGVFVVQGDNLVEREPPAPDLLIDQFELLPTLTEELPDWETVRETLVFEFEDPDPKVLAKFRKNQWDNYASAEDAIRVGGCAHWIQGAESDLPVIAQLSADNDTDLGLIDCGSIYVCQHPNGNLEAFLQSY